MSIYNRSPVAEFLLQGGQHQSWLLGNNIITITTSGGSKVGRAGLCDKCLQVARTASKKADDVSVSDLIAQSATTPTSGRRRHKSAAVKSHSETYTVKVVSQDDMHILRQSSRDNDAASGDSGDLDVNRATSLDSLSRRGEASSCESLRSREELRELVGQGSGSGSSSGATGLHTHTQRIEALDSVLMG